MSIYATRSDDPNEFLYHDNRNDLMLSSAAAIEACVRASSAGLSITKVEGGHWLSPGIKVRMDSIWEVRRLASSREEAQRWNISAAEFIRNQANESPDPDLPPADVFILTAAKLTLNPVGIPGTKHVVDGD